eukprot:5994157-Heterocapsa_arctica.AAC.1
MAAGTASFPAPLVDVGVWATSRRASAAAGEAWSIYGPIKADANVAAPTRASAPTSRRSRDWATACREADARIGRACDLAAGAAVRRNAPPPIDAANMRPPAPRI